MLAFRHKNIVTCRACRGPRGSSLRSYIARVTVGVGCPARTKVWSSTFSFAPFVVYRNLDLLISMYEYLHDRPIWRCYMILRMTESGIWSHWSCCLRQYYSHKSMPLCWVDLTLCGIKIGASFVRYRSLREGRGPLETPGRSNITGISPEINSKSISTQLYNLRRLFKGFPYRTFTLRFWLFNR